MELYEGIGKSELTAQTPSTTGTNEALYIFHLEQTLKTDEVIGTVYQSLLVIMNVKRGITDPEKRKEGRQLFDTVEQFKCALSETLLDKNIYALMNDAPHSWDKVCKSVTHVLSQEIPTQEEKQVWYQNEVAMKEKVHTRSERISAQEGERSITVVDNELTQRINKDIFDGITDYRLVYNHPTYQTYGLGYAVVDLDCPMKKNRRRNILEEIAFILEKVLYKKLETMSIKALKVILAEMSRIFHDSRTDAAPQERKRESSLRTALFNVLPKKDLEWTLADYSNK